MHLPDGFVSPTIALATTAVAAGALGLAVVKARREDDERLVPLVGVTAAFLFAIQMLNIPIGAGTSGHVMGGTLAVALLGPWLGLLAMTVTLLLQAFLFGDGGITTLGANVLVLGVAGGWGSYGMLLLALRMGLPRKHLPAAAAVVAWVSLVLASACCAGILALSGTVPANLVFPAMMGVHAVIGVGEALVTSAALGLVLAWRPDLLRWTPQLATSGAYS